MVFQSYAIWPHMTIFENVAFPLRMSKVPEAETVKKVEEVLSLVELEGLSKRMPNTLSGGQQQRVAIARSLVAGPAILLADEPTGNLDTESSQEIMAILADLNRRDGLTVLVVTHDSDVAAYTSREVLMKDGHLVGDRNRIPSEVVTQ